MITLDCPKCERPIEVTFTSDETYDLHSVAVVDEINREQACLEQCAFTKEEMRALEDDALRILMDQDPPGDY